MIGTFPLMGLSSIFHRDSIHYPIDKILVNRCLSKEFTTRRVLQTFLFSSERAHFGKSSPEGKEGHKECLFTPSFPFQSAFPLHFMTSWVALGREGLFAPGET